MKTKSPLLFVCIATLAITITACTGSGATVSSGKVVAGNPTTTTSAANPKTADASTFSDPFQYCGAVTNIDAPDAKYTGPKMPDTIVKGLMKASGASADAPTAIFASNSFWRCMNGKVYACFVGANLPCQSKANTDKTPTPGETDFCKANSSADTIPAAVTGHDTVYEWNCKNGQPEIVKQVFQVDERGFIADIWYPINPQ